MELREGRANASQAIQQGYAAEWGNLLRIITDGNVSTMWCDRPYLDVLAGRWLAMGESEPVERRWVVGGYSLYNRGKWDANGMFLIAAGSAFFATRRGLRVDRG